MAVASPGEHRGGRSPDEAARARRGLRRRVVGYASLRSIHSRPRWRIATRPERLSTQASDLAVDPDRIAIGGASAGAGLAAALALLARDRAEVAVVFQLLIYPMIDDRNIAPATANLPDTLLWTRENNRVGWYSYLGQDTIDGRVPAYAAVSRATNMTGLPPAYLCLGELDLFVNEDIAYAQRLIEAGVPTELHVYPGAYPASIARAAVRVARRFIAERDWALKRALQRAQATRRGMKAGASRLRV